MDMNTKEVDMNEQLPTEPGWYQSDGTNGWMIYRLSSDTIDGSYQWHAIAGNGDSTPCDPEYIEQAGPVSRLVPLSVEEREVTAAGLRWNARTCDRNLATARAERLRALAARIAPDQNGDGA